MAIDITVCKLDPSAILPRAATTGSACCDIYANEDAKIAPGDKAIVGTGLAFEIPSGTVMKLFVRSGMAKEGIILGNGVGILDSDYRGELKIILSNIGYDGLYQIKKGQRIAQFLIEPVWDIDMREVSRDDLTPTGRGEGGFGSTGG